jgi:exportin-T
MISRFSPLCWALPTTPSFNSKDALAKQVLAEAGSLQRTIYLKTGMEYVEYLRTRELPGMGMGGDLIEEFLTALSRLDMKGFRQFFPVRGTVLASQSTICNTDFALLYSHSSSD